MEVCEGEIFGIVFFIFFMFVFYRDADFSLSGDVVDGKAAVVPTADSELSRFQITLD